jgi:hypothetical protein
MSEFSRDEVEATYERWRAALAAHDDDAMLDMLSENACVGNAVFGLYRGKKEIRRFFARWPRVVPNESVWHVIEGARVVDKWREILPGVRSDGNRYEYVGIVESIYAGNGRWSFLYSIPDVTGLHRVYAEWRADGQHEIHGEVYPALAEVA